MSTKTKSKQENRLALVLDRLYEAACRSEAEMSYVCDMLNDMLDEANENDAWGTEAQCDPRGDFRNEEWTMRRVQGID